MDRMDFTYYNDNLYKLEEFGFKIHISATIKNYTQVFDIVSKLLERERTMYKCLSDFDKIYKNFSENESSAAVSYTHLKLYIWLSNNNL